MTAKANSATRCTPQPQVSPPLPLAGEVGSAPMAVMRLVTSPICTERLTVALAENRATWGKFPSAGASMACRDSGQCSQVLKCLTLASSFLASSDTR